ncbi:hypothetical protein GW796_07000 [archaeon]|nr:hypothetical protein [archaeon]
MYFLATVFIGWNILNLFLAFIEYLFEMTPNSLSDVIFIYIFVGYLVMMIYKVKSPLVKNNENPFTSFKSLEFKLFFKDIYFALWWPYYIIKKQ